MTVPFTKTFNPGEILTAADVNEHLLNGGYQFREQIRFTSSGQFVKADYPWLRAIRVRCQGGGGGGGGAAGASNRRNGAGGGGGAYAESFITDIAGLSASVTVTRGGGGAGGVGSANAGNGETSSFGALVSASGGDGVVNEGRVSGRGGSSAVGQLTVFGSGGSPAAFLNAGAPGGSGGSSVLGGAGSGKDAVTAGPGLPGEAHGGGGGGCLAADLGPQNGGAGANGIVIVDLFG